MDSSFTDNQNNNARKKGKLHTKSKSRGWNTSGRRAHHNALEQQRRGVIRSCFESLRKSVPTLDSEEKKLSRSGILRETARYIKTTRERMAGYQADIEELRLQNQLLSNEVECLETLPSETTSLYKDYDSLTKTRMEDKQPIRNNQCFVLPSTEVKQIGKSTANFSKDRQQHFAASSSNFSLVERNLLEERKYFDSNSLQPEKEILLQKISEDEEFLVDVEGFAQSPFSLYGLPWH